MTERELTNEQRADVYRELAGQGLTIHRSVLLAMANELDPPAPVTIDKVPGWEVVWCSRGAIAVTNYGNVSRQWTTDPGGIIIGSVRHPWPERPEPLAGGDDE